METLQQQPELSEDAFLQLADPVAIKYKVREAEEKFRSISKKDWLALRRRAKTDLFFLDVGVLGYDRLSVQLHGHLATWYQRFSARQFREVLLPRGHFKSTEITIGDSIQTVLPDDEGDQDWPRNLGTDCRLCIVHETSEMASRFLFSITAHFTSNTTLMGLFPECVPNPRKNRINKQELELPRSKIWNEPTIDTMGVGAKGQGRHYNRMMLDDLIGDKARDSQVEMRSAKDWFDNVQSFFSLLPKDQFVLIGTRWAFDDLYAHAHEMYGDQLARYIRGVEEYSEVTKQKEPIFPEEVTKDKLTILRKNKKVFSAQYANDPAEGATEFEGSWLRSFYWLDRQRIYTLNNKLRVITQLSNMDRIILVDPAMSGLSGYCVVGTDYKDCHYVLKSVKKDWTPAEFVSFLFLEVARWQPRLVAIEEVLFSGLYKPFIEAEMKLRNSRFHVELVRVGKTEKAARVRGLATFWSVGQIYTSEDQGDLLEEFSRFGATTNYHILDALSQGPALWRRGIVRHNEESEEAQDSSRDVLTGYSSI